MPSVKVDVVFCNGNQLRSLLNYLFINKKNYVHRDCIDRNIKEHLICEAADLQLQLKIRPYMST